MPTKISALQHQIIEWSYTSAQNYTDPFNEVELDVSITRNKQSWNIPAFWAGANEWRVRFAPPEPGTYQIRSHCSDPTNPALHNQESTLEVSENPNANPLFQHGPLQLSPDKRKFQFADGTPFFWLGDTWWMGLCRRWSWPDDFQLMAADRVAKGFNVVQIVAGLYPDMPGFDPRSANEAGFAWEAAYTRINPAYFDSADLRIQWLVRSGLIPCIVAGWGYYLPLLGIAKMKQHWRNLIARWAAYPVVWCLAGEATMPYYLLDAKERDAEMQKQGWTEIGRYVRKIDPFHRLITVHPTQYGRDQVTDDRVLDFEMLQTGHGGYESVPNTITSVRQACQRKPTMPVLVAEVNYEGIIHQTHDEIQRLTFWTAILSGAAGFTYGANGIWQINTRRQTYGPSPHGGNWGITPWEDAISLPGAKQLGLAHSFLARFSWWQFEPHPEWVTPAGSAEAIQAPFAAGIPGKVRIIYFFQPTYAWEPRRMQVHGLERGYHAIFWDPRTGTEYDLGAAIPDASGDWDIPVQPTFSDWVLVLEKRD